VFFWLAAANSLNAMMLSIELNLYVMKKITFILALVCSLSAFSTRYLVQGTTGTNTWRTANAGAGEVNVTTSDFRTWYYATFTAGYTYNAADEIWLAGGTYTLSYSFGTRKVNVYGGFAGTETSIASRSKISGGKAWEFTTPTILDGKNLIPQGFSSQGIATTPNTYIDGVTITKCQVTNVTASVYGVGAYVSQGCVMQNCIVSSNTYNNTAASNLFDGNGAGIYLTGGQVLDSYINNNQLVKGNGRNTYGGGIAFASSLNTVKGCTIENNSCTQFGGGMEIILTNGGTIEDCIFKTNSTAGLGGGMGATNTSGTSTLSIKNCQFIENTSTTGAGGADLNLTATTPGTTTIDGCSFVGNIGPTVGGLNCVAGVFSIKNSIFRDNSYTSSATEGASALNSNVANTTVQNCVFTNNSSVASGSKNHTVKLTNGGNCYNCTFANNNEPGSAGYTFTFNAAVGTIKNCVFWNNTNTQNFSGVANNGISNYNATTSTPIKNTTGSGGGGTTGNITTLTISPNNTFVSPTNFVGVPSTSDGGVQKAASAAADWSLLTGCPAKNAGIDLSATPTFITTDILGNTRPTGANKVDMGAYEVLNVTDYADGSNINVSSSGHLTISATKTLGNITVDAGGKLSVASGQALTLTNLTLKSNASGTSTFVSDGTLTVSGTTAVEQYLATTRNWYVSSPVSNAVAPAGYTYYGRYEPGGTETGWTAVSVGAGLVAGKGYIALPGTTGLPITFTTQSGGTLNSGNITIPITYTALATSAKGFNLIGNPYPSHLTWTKTFVDNNVSLIEPSIYYRTNAGSVNSGVGAAWSFKTYNSSTNEFSPAGTTNIIPPMQAFWIKAKTSGNLILNSDLTKSHQTSNPLKAPALKNTNRQRVRLEVSNGTRTDETLLLFDANATDGYDVFDSPKFTESNSEVQIYTSIGNEKFVMNGMKTLPLNQEIALGFVQGNATSFSLKANEISNLPNDVRVILKDNVTKAETDLTDGLTSYQFTPEVISTDRFSLFFRAPGVTTGIENGTNINVQVFVNAANQITIIGAEKSTYSIYNAVGQQIEFGKLNANRETLNTKLDAGIYVVRVSDNGRIYSTRVVLNGK